MKACLIGRLQKKGVECTLGEKEEIRLKDSESHSARQSVCSMNGLEDARVCGTHTLFYVKLEVNSH